MSKVPSDGDGRAGQHESGRGIRRPLALWALVAVLVLGVVAGAFVVRQAVSGGASTARTAAPTVSATPTLSVDQLVGLEWTLTELDVDGISYSMPHRVPTLHFYPGTEKIGGWGVCNPYYAMYALAGTVLRLSNIGVSTYVACGFEMDFLDGLERVGRIEVQSPMLRMTSDDYRVRIIFQLTWTLKTSGTAG